MKAQIDLVTLFYHVDIFCQKLNETFDKKPLLTQAKRRKRSSKMTLSELLTVFIYFHYSGYTCFKWYYYHFLVPNKSYFSRLLSYSRLVELQPTLTHHLQLFARIHGGNSTGISFVDSTPLEVANTRREYSHKVFKGLASKGKTSVGWFFGFKLHYTINQVGEIINFTITSGNVSDANENVLDRITQRIHGKLFGDKGYVGRIKQMMKKGIRLIHRPRKNMKDVKILEQEDAILLKKRGLIESVNNVLKNMLQLEHSRHRSPANFVAHICSTIAAYALYQNKPRIGIYA